MYFKGGVFLGGIHMRGKGWGEGGGGRAKVRGGSRAPEQKREENNTRETKDRILCKTFIGFAIPVLIL